MPANLKKGKSNKEMKATDQSHDDFDDMLAEMRAADFIATAGTSNATSSSGTNSRSGSISSSSTASSSHNISASGRG
jgi:hypothetical protein